MSSSMRFIIPQFATRDNLKETIVGIFPMISFKRIENLLNDLESDISFLIEYPYIDKHYRDSFYFYYSSKFLDYTRFVARIHIFKGSVTSYDELISLTNDYAGFFIIRPLELHPLGRSMISPSILKQKGFFTCTTKEKIHVFDLAFEVESFPHVAQDKETHTCAESAIWSILSYFGCKYDFYKTQLTSDILGRLNTFANHKLLPSKGLTVEEAATCLNSSGQNCMIYSRTKAYRFDFISTLQIYIESGMPVLAALGNGTEGHAVVISGHGSFDYRNVTNNFLKPDEIWKDISYYPKKLVLIDDNKTPFDIVSSKSPAEHYIEYNNMQLKSIIVPFHKHMFMDAENARELITRIFNDKKNGLHNFGNKWITRLFLTPGTSFKKSVYNDRLLDIKLKNLFKYTLFPKFIWVCEIYRLEDYENQICSGILILDSTGDISLKSIMYYIVGDKRIIQYDSNSWAEQHTMKNLSFKKEPYKNNLKEV